MLWMFVEYCDPEKIYIYSFLQKRSIKNEFWTQEETLKGETTTERNSFFVKSRYEGMIDND